MGYYKIEIVARPVPKARPRLGANGRMYTPKETKEFEELVGWCTRSVVKKPVEKPVKVNIDVFTKSRADIDNIAKAILDGLNGVAFLDDRQVVELRIRKLPPVDCEKIVISIKETRSVQKCKNSG
ncbi:endodeoxyribonuclease RusA [Caldicellulosiruptor acetigenus I77R1B]|uniref:Endodeoxyribonuclease RusA n=1 Tax=Caldicellulosiruptor acetigenus (strain ATCC 700853 / DSM 12137 / I77R1B) TaxID=632335 RepID=E4S5C8_CALA7|nr:RusA family crossover junction endodeoxyribonuclease [Caldicellulosiruptor acetigenus]ADQ41562.1 endodeoxyribonuclease RusA [Caldicellulosiruptor acetigenus I77R1B]